jgi:cytochrome c-type biogenesis protein CcmE
MSLTEIPVGPRRRRSLASRRQRWSALALIAAALAFLLVRGLSNALDYYLTAKQAVAQRVELGSKEFRIQGTVMPGVHQRGTDLDFSITSSHVAVKIVSSGAPPQLFKVGLPVVLEGHWQGDTFMSDQIMVQHGSSYVEAKPKPKTRTAAGAKGRPGLDGT